VSTVTFAALEELNPYEDGELVALLYTLRFPLTPDAVTNTFLWKVVFPVATELVNVASNDAPVKLAEVLM